MATKTKFEEVENSLDAIEFTAPSVKTETKKPVAKPVQVDDVAIPSGLDTDTRRLYRAYKAEPRVEIMIAPMYAAYFGNIMQVSINGITVKVPCNGSRISVPATFAAEINRRMFYVNKRLAREKGMSTSSVFENSPGDAELF